MSYKAGSVIGDYVVIGAAGAGGMGTVYKVQHVITQRIEAMKLLASGRTDADQEQRFLREMQLQARLHHPNIAAVYNAFRFYEEFFLVMEFIDGESLDSILSRGRLALPTGLNFARQALFALGYAHAHGVVHRDIAPSNMLITPDGTVKLTDFGLAKTATDVRLTHSGAPLGSPWYMSPEQVRGTAILDARSDIYSLGAVLYEIVTGTRPFDLASTFDVMRAQVETAPKPPIERALGLPPTLNEIILTALAKDPSARFQSAEQFYAALEPLLTATPRAMMAQAQAAPRPPQPVRPGARIPKAPAFPRLRMVQAALGSAACLSAVFIGYSAYSFLRATSTTQTQQVVPAKAAIPPEPVIPAALPVPPPPVEETAPPALEAVVEPAPRPRKTTRALVARTAPPAAAVQPLRDFPLAPERLAPPALESPIAVQTSRTASALLIPAAPAAVAPVRAQADADPQVITNSPDASVDATSKDKKDGNRFMRALHKIKLFHKGTPEGSDSSSQ